MSDVVIIDDTTVLVDLLVTVREKEVHAVFVAVVRGEQRGVEMRLVLVLEIASGVGVFKVKAEIQSFAGIHCELRIDMILTAGLVSAVIVEDIGKWRERVHEEKLVRLCLDKAVGLCEGEVVWFGTVDEDTALTGRVVAACVVVLTVHAAVKSSVHEQVGHGVGLCGNDVAEGAVYGPGTDTLGNFLVAGGVVVVLIKVIVVAALGDVSHLVNLVVSVLGERRER